MSGRFGIHTGAVGHGNTNADMRIEGKGRGFRDKLESQSLPGFLRTAGLKTISISPFGERHSAWTFYAGFSEMHNTGKGGGESAEEVTPTALKWIENNASEDNWFLQLNYWDPHTPYRAPAEFGNPFENEPPPEWIDQEVFDEHHKHIGPHSAQEINMWHGNENPDLPRHPGAIHDLEGVKKVMDGYDCGIRYADDHVGMIMAALEEQGVADDVAVIISSDHGENLGELGLYGEHGTADYITCRIPMIIRWPGGQQGQVDSGLHYNLDLAPTLAELLNVEAASGWDGSSYAAQLLNGQDCSRDHLIISQCAHVCQRGVRFGPWMYIRTYHDGFHLFPDEMLFNIEEDPHEQHNLAEERRQECLQAVYYLNQWHDDMMKTMPDAVDPLWTVIREGGPLHARGKLKSYCKRLEETGRSYGIEELKRRHPQEFV